MVPCLVTKCRKSKNRFWSVFAPRKLNPCSPDYSKVAWFDNNKTILLENGSPEATYQFTLRSIVIERHIFFFRIIFRDVFLLLIFCFSFFFPYIFEGSLWVNWWRNRKAVRALCFAKKWIILLNMWMSFRPVEFLIVYTSLIPHLANNKDYFEL